MGTTQNVAARLAAFVARVSRAFFDVKPNDDLVTGGKKVGKTALHRVIYTLADYWLMAASAAYIILVDQTLGFGWFGLFMMMWGFDIVVAAAFVVVWKRTGHDVTLGESYRRAADVIHAESRLAGVLAIVGVCIKATFWDGPEHIVIFFNKEIRTEARMALILLGLTAVQAAIWTPVFILGFETATELFEFLWQRIQ
jgi:hypothetical protein